ncbi:pectinesterase family protein [Caulobacter segnis]
MPPPKDKPSRQYFKDCYIEGHVDFIFGDAKGLLRALPHSRHRPPDGDDHRSKQGASRSGQRLCLSTAP